MSPDSKDTVAISSACKLMSKSSGVLFSLNGIFRAVNFDAMYGAEIAEKAVILRIIAFYQDTCQLSFESQNNDQVPCDLLPYSQDFYHLK